MTRLIRITRPQARAILTVLRLGERPSCLDRHEKRALTSLEQRLKAAIEQEPPHPLTADLDRLEDRLLSARSRAFHDHLHRRVRDLLTVALLWTAAEELPADGRAPLLDLDRLPDPAWAADVLDECAKHGLRVRLPSEPAGDEPDRGGG